MIAFPRRRGLAAVLVVVLVLLIWGAAGWTRVPADRHVVRDSTWLRVQPRPLSPGWHWLPAGLITTRSYPRGEVDTAYAVGIGETLRTREGAAVAARGSVRWRVDESGLARLARDVGNAVAEDLIVPAVRDSARHVLETGLLRAGGGGASALEEALRPRLSAAGVTLVSVSVDAVGPPNRVAAGSGAQARPIAGAKILLVGWDGADWNVIDPMLDRGELPHLAGLLARGTRGRLRSVTPMLSPVIWTSMATGTRPDKHGIVDFLARDPRTGTRVPVTSNLRRMPALWNILRQHGMSVGVVAWWATWPAEQVNGYMVTDRIAYQLFGMGESLPQTAEGKTWPPELFDELSPLIVKPEAVRDDEVRRFAPRAVTGSVEGDDRTRLESFRTVLAATETYTRIALHLAGRPVDFRAVYFEATDTAAHLFMPFAPPPQPHIDQRQQELWGEVIHETYRDLDGRLGRLLETADDDTTILLVSDHGFRSGVARPRTDSRIGAGRAGDWHRKFGILVMAGRGIQAGAKVSEASVIDIAPTVLALFGLPVPEQMDGDVLESGLTAAFLRSHPVRREGETRLERASQRPITSEEDEAILERLRTLGYVGGEEGGGGGDVGTGDVGRLEQDEITAYNNRGTILLSEGKPEEAIAELQRGLKRAPGSRPLRINMGRALQASGDEDRALEMLQGVLSEEPSPSVENIVGNIFMARGELGRAAEHFRRALEQEPTSADIQISLGLLAERQGNTDEALTHFRRAAELNPDSSEAFNNIGNVLRARAVRARAAGDEARAGELFAAAEKEYRLGLEADPAFIGTYNNLGLVLQDVGRDGEAFALYEEALERAPEHSVVLNNLGSLHFRAGRLAEARSAFEQAIAAREDYESAYNNLGAVLGRQGFRQEELDAYRQAVALDPGYTDGHHNLGLALLRLNQVEEGMAELRRVVEIDPDYLPAWAAMGEVQLQLGNYAAAVDLFREALRINPSALPVRNLLAEAYLASGDTEKGKAEYRRSLQMRPDQPRIRQRLQSLGE